MIKGNFSKEDFSDMIKRSGTSVKRLQVILNDPDAFCFTWNKGWLTWKILVNENKRIFHITSAWNSNKTSRKNSVNAWKDIVKLAKRNNCKTMRLKTGRNPNGFARKYGFKTIIRTMEKEI